MFLTLMCKKKTSFLSSIDRFETLFLKTSFLGKTDRFAFFQHYAALHKMKINVTTVLCHNNNVRGGGGWNAIAMTSQE